MAKLLRVMPLSIALAGSFLTLCVGAESIVELAPSSVIAIDQLEPVGKLPVVTAVACYPQRRLLVTAGDDHLVRLGCLAGNEPLRELREAGDNPPERRLSAHNDWVRSAVIGPSGEMMATTGFDCRIVLWDILSGEPVQQFSEPGSSPRALAFSPDGLTLAAAGFDQQVRLYDVSSRQPIKQFEAPGTDIRAVVFSPDGSRLAAAGRLGVVRVWELSTGSVLREFKGPGRRMHALAYSPDGEKIVAAGEGPDILIWHAADGNLAATLPIRPGKVMAIAFCGPNLLAAGGSNNTIGVWNLLSGRQELSLAGHTGSVTSLAWDTESEVLISGSFDTTVRTWQLARRAVDTVAGQ